jgi:hypothetical protein
MHMIILVVHVEELLVLMLCVCVCFDDTWLFIVWQRHMTSVVWLFESINNPGLKFIKRQSLWDILYLFLTAEILY